MDSSSVKAVTDFGKRSNALLEKSSMRSLGMPSNAGSDVSALPATTSAPRKGRFRKLAGIDRSRFLDTSRYLKSFILAGGSSSRRLPANFKVVTNSNRPF
jgi:hypothetical protein